MTDTTAKIAGKGCSSTGITEDIAVRYHDQLGKKMIAIVELVSDTRTEKKDGKQTVGLSILSIEPATDQIAEDHLRDVQRALFMNRRMDEGQPTLEGDEPEPTVKQVVEARGQAILERDEETGEITGLWDGNTDDEPDADDEDQGDDTESDSDPYSYVHAKGSPVPGSETKCALRSTVGKTLRTHVDPQEITCPECRDQVFAGLEDDDTEPVIA